jgi:GAF domain-containing protein
MMQIYEEACKRALQMSGEKYEPYHALCQLITAAEYASPGTVCSILLLDDEGLLRNGASPKLPADYLQAIDGLRPAANVGTCAAAAATGSIVITEDFYSDSKWPELRHLPLALGFKGAWSMPIKNADGKVIGTFGTYFTTKRKPSAEEIEGVRHLAATTATILESREILAKHIG